MPTCPENPPKARPRAALPAGWAGLLAMAFALAFLASCASTTETSASFGGARTNATTQWLHPSLGGASAPPPGSASSGASAPVAAPQAPEPPRPAQILPASMPARGMDPYAFPADAPPVLADAFMMIDARTGETIAYRNPTERRAVASTQKLLTALLVVERGNLDQTIVIRPEDTKAPPSKMYLKPGQRITRRELLTVFLVKSANDAADALARDHSGSIPAFANAMNRKARELGATSSRFVNPHGLTESGQFSTARDMARIAFAAYRDPFIRRCATMQECTVAGRSYKATNKLLKRMPECTGLKTGYTQASGKCLISTARINGRDIILVQLGSKDASIWDDAARLMRWGATRSRVPNYQVASLAPRP